MSQIISELGYKLDYQQRIYREMGKRLVSKWIEDRGQRRLSRKADAVHVPYTVTRMDLQS